MPKILYPNIKESNPSILLDIIKKDLTAFKSSIKILADIKEILQ